MNANSSPTGRTLNWGPFCKLTSLVVALVAGLLMAVPSICRADTAWTGAVDQDWLNAGNWTNGVPDDAANNGNAIINIGTGNTPIYSTTGPAIDNLLRIGDGGNTGYVEQTGGTLNSTNGDTYIGPDTGSSGTYKMTGGTLNANTVWLGGWGDNTSLLDISNATANVNYIQMANSTAGDQTMNATVNVWNGGTLNCESDFVVGIGGDGASVVNIESGGTVNIASTILRWLILTRYDSDDATLNVFTNGTLNLYAGSAIKPAPQNESYKNTGTRVINVDGGSILAQSTGSAIDFGYDNPGVNQLDIKNGGVVQCWAIFGGGNATKTLNFDNGTLRPTEDGSYFINFTTANYSVNILSGGATLDTDGHNAGIRNGLLDGGGGGGLTKIGAGTLTLLGAASTYTGNTTISAGTLALGSGASINNSANIIVSSGATFDVSAISYTLGAGQTLSGNGSVTGNVATASATANIAPGASAGTLTFDGDLDMSAGGNATFELTTSHSSGNDQIVVVSNLVLNGSSKIHISALSGTAPLDTTGDYVLFQVGTSTSTPTDPVLVWDGTKPSNYLNYSLLEVGRDVVLHYTSATAPTVSASADPTSLTRNQAVTITAVVTPGSGSIASVRADLTDIGGSSTASLVLSSGNTYTNTFTVAPTTSPGAKAVTVTVTDNTIPIALTGSDVVNLTVNAANKIWDGGSVANDNWTSNPNWASDAAPAYSGDSVTFAGATRLTPNMDTNYSLTGLTFDAGASSFNIGTANSSVLTLTGGIVNNSANAQTLNVPVALSGSQTVSNGAAGNLTLAGSISASADITKTGTGTATLSGTSNSVSGKVSVGGGTLGLADAGYMTVSGEVIAAGGTFGLAGDANMRVASRVKVGDLNNSGALNVNSSGTLRALQSVNVGNTDLGGAYTAAGTLTVSSGTLACGGSSSGPHYQSGGLNLAAANNAAASVSGTLIVDGGNVVVTNDAVIGFSGQGTGTLTINSGSFNMGPTGQKWLSVGQWDTVKGIVNVAGGDLKMMNNSSIKFSRGGGSKQTNVVNQTGGNITFYSDAGATVGGNGNLDLQLGGSASSRTTYNLDGGVLTVPKIQSTTTSGTNIFNFNGGKLKAAGASTSFFGSGVARTANVRNGGAIIDTAGFAVTIGQSLTHSAIGGDNATDGGLTKQGAGTLTLTGTNTYTGATKVLGGTLSVSPSSTLYLNDLTVSNATLKASAPNYSYFLANNVTFKGASALTIDFGQLTVNPYSAVISSSGPLVNSGTVTINITADGLQPGTVPLIGYSGTPVTTANFVLGTLPAGITAHLSDSSFSLDLVIDSAGQQLTWYGLDGGLNVITTWDIGTSDNWIDSVYGINVPYMEYGSIGDNVIFNDNIGTLQATNVNITTTVKPATLKVDNDSYDFHFTGAGSIGGVVTLVKTNLGSLYLETANTYSGGTVISGGSVIITDDNALGNASSPVTLAGGTLQLNANVTGSRPVNLTASSTIGVATNTSSTLSGDITGTGTLTKVGAGAATISGNITNISGLINDGSGGTLTLSGDVATTGTINFNNGTGVVSAAVSPGAAELWVANGAGNSGVLDLQTGAVVSAANWIAVGRSSANGTLNINGGELIKTGAGNLTTAGIGGTQTGTINLNSGSISNTTDTWIGETGTGIYNQLGGTSTLAYVRVGWSSNVNLLNISGGTATANHVDVGYQNGYGTVTVSGGSSFSVSSMDIARSTAANHICQGTVIVDGSTLNSEGDLTVGLGGQATSGAFGTMIITNGSTVNVASDTLRWLRVGRYDSVTSTLIVNSGSTLNLNAGSDIRLSTDGNSGTKTITVDDATIAGSAGVGGGSASYMWLADGTLNLTNGGQIIGWNDIEAGTGTINVESGCKIQMHYLDAWDGTVNVNGGGMLELGALFSGGAGSAYIDNGTLKANQDELYFINFFGTGQPYISAGGVTIDTAGYNVRARTPLLEDSGSTGGGLTKTGLGTLTLLGTNTYTGTTTVSQGTLLVNGSIGSGATVAAGATLGGNGTVNGLVTVNGGGTISPGASIGTLTLDTNPTLNGTLYIEIYKTNGLPEMHDVLTNTSGSITYAGVLKVQNIGPNLKVGDKFQLFPSAVTTFSGIILSPTDDSGAVYTWQNDIAVDGSITVTEVNARLYAVTRTGNLLISFSAAQPGTILSAVTITGLGLGEEVQGIDFLGNTLYAVGSSSALYTLDPVTGAATKVGAFTPVLSGVAFGVDADPAGIRVMSDLGQNLVLNPTTGVATAGTPLTFSGNSQGFTSPSVVGLAYNPANGNYYVLDNNGAAGANNFAGTVNPSSGGVTLFSQSSGIDWSRYNGFDISPNSDHTAYIASPAQSSGAQANLYSLDLNPSSPNYGIAGFEGQIGDTEGYLVRALAVGPAYSTAIPVNPTITAEVTGGGTILSLSWPDSGWTLQAQTNSLSVGLSDNWADVAGSSSVTQTNLPIVKTNPMVLYRLVQ